MTGKEAQARRDAEWDVEQLRRMVDYDDDAEEAYRMGGWIIMHLATGDARAAYNAACSAACHAFRAVPALRGETK